VPEAMKPRRIVIAQKVPEVVAAKAA
jgi:hypothetical protein